MPPKRKPTDTAATSKRFRSALDAVADEFLCPITQELPIDPVTAEDGTVYERSAIEEWLARPRPAGQRAKSPVTNELMGPRLCPARQIRNTIKGMVLSGALSGDKANAWKARLEEEEEVAEVRRAAEGGDGNAALQLGGWYDDGEKGLKRDEEQAFHWYKRGADVGNVTAMNACAACYEDGEGVDENEPLALFYYTQSACSGSELGCFNLGKCFADGDVGLEVDKAQAKRWFERMPACAEQDADEKTRAKAERRLAKLSR